MCSSLFFIFVLFPFHHLLPLVRNHLGRLFLYVWNSSCLNHFFPCTVLLLPFQCGRRENGTHFFSLPLFTIHTSFSISPRIDCNNEGWKKKGKICMQPFCWQPILAEILSHILVSNQFDYCPFFFFLNVMLLTIAEVFHALKKKCWRCAIRSPSVSLLSTFLPYN